MVGSVNSINSVGMMSNYPVCNKVVKCSAKPSFQGEAKADVFNKTNVATTAPEISRTRLAFGRLTDEQIAAVNAAGKLPENAKFISNGFGGYVVCNNFFGLRAGTQVLPAGFEVKKNVLGFTCVVPKGTKGLLIKD